MIHNRTPVCRQEGHDDRGPSGTRGAQLALAAFWAIDALLQLQPANFTGSLVSVTILGNAENQPQPIYGSLLAASRLFGPYHVELNIGIIAIQLLIAGGLVWRRTARAALLGSIVWALGVWWLGEGFGGVFAGKATLLVGGPGAALLYALLALVALPPKPLGARPHAPSRAFGPRVLAADGALGERATLASWTLLWAGGAILRIVPFWFAPVYALAGDFQLGLNEEPRWLYGVNERLSHLAATAGLPLVIAIAVVEAAVGVGVLTRHRRAFLSAGIALSLLYWVFGQQLAGLLTGSATDLGAGPLYILLAYTLWPRHGRFSQRRAATAVASPQGDPNPGARSQPHVSLPESDHPGASNAPVTQQITAGVFRVADGIPNWHWVERDGEVALYDAGTH